MPSTDRLDVGIYTIPAALYHADPCPEPSLSSSIVRMLCIDSPLHVHHAHPRLNPAAADDESEAMDVGTAAHALLLEGSTAIEIIEADDWRKKDVREKRDQAYKDGKVPLLKRKWDDVQAMVACAALQLGAHTDGGAEMFKNGLPEQTLIWRERDVWCRARLDWLRAGAVDDYKSTGATANPDVWSRSLFSAGFDVQVAWYLRGVKAVQGFDATFRFAVQETYAPYALSVIGLGPDALVLAEKKILYAFELWRACRAKDKWPGYPTRTAWASLPMAHEAWWLEKELRA